MPLSIQRWFAGDRSAAKPSRGIPLFLKILLSLFVCIMVPVYYRSYGPANFLYICDVAMLLTLLGVWIESPLLLSMQAVGILLPQSIWLVDFAFRLCGIHLVGITDYMFVPGMSVVARGLSLFHGWLPILLVWLVARLGYDRRAFAAQSVFGIGLLLFCYFVSPVSPGSSQFPVPVFDINYVYGPDAKIAQTFMDGRLWILMLCAVATLVVYLPTHLALAWIFAPRPAGEEVKQPPRTAIENV